MDKRLFTVGFIIAAILLWLGRRTLLDIITQMGGFDLLPQDQEVETFPGLVIPTLPKYNPAPSSWRQTTGLYCGCDFQEYFSPFATRTVQVPRAPTPRFIPPPPVPTPAKAAEPPMTYHEFGMDSSYTLWGDKPYEKVWRGSDGRIFLQPKRNVWGLLEPNTTNDPQLIGTDEYTMVDGDIHYGPYIYKRIYIAEDGFIV